MLLETFSFWSVWQLLKPLFGLANFPYQWPNIERLPYTRERAHVDAGLAITSPFTIHLFITKHVDFDNFPEFAHFAGHNGLRRRYGRFGGKRLEWCPEYSKPAQRQYERPKERRPHRSPLAGPSAVFLPNQYFRLDKPQSATYL